LRILLVSDLHYTLPQLDWVVHVAPSFDLVVLADRLDISSPVSLDTQSVVILRYLSLLKIVLTKIFPFRAATHRTKTQTPPAASPSCTTVSPGAKRLSGRCADKESMSFVVFIVHELMAMAHHQQNGKLFHSR